MIGFFEHIATLVRGKSNSSSVARNVAIRFALLGLNVCTGVLVARSLGPTGRGEQAAIALWPSFISTLATLGIPTALNFHSRRDPDSALRLYMSSVIVMLAIGLLTSAIGAASMGLLLHGYGQDTIRAAQWFMLFAPETLVASAARAYLESQNQFSRSALGFFYPSLATLVGLLILRTAGHLTPMYAALAYLVPPAIQACWIVSRLWSRERFRLHRLASDIRQLLPYGLQCYGIDIINALSGQMDLVIIVAFLSPMELGVYTVALSLSRVMNIVNASVNTVLFPRATSLGPDAAIDLVERSARISTLASLTLGIMLFIVAQFAVPFVYGAAFIAALPVFGILIVENTMGGFAAVHFQSFMATGRPRWVTIIQAAWTIAAIGFLYLLVPRMNLTGAATGLLLAAIVRVALVIVCYPLVLDRPIPNVFFDMSDFRYIRNTFRSLRVDRQLLAAE